MNTKKIIYEVVNLKKEFKAKGGFFDKSDKAVKAVDGVSFEVYKGETLGIVGESGCGKTTLGKNLMMLQKPTSGHINFNFGDNLIDLTEADKEQLMSFKMKVQMVFQDPYSSFNPMKKIYNAFDEPLRKHNKGNKQKRIQIMEDMMRTVNLPPEYIYRYPHEFSGGQRQRINIARALSINPEVVVFDEPVSALDVSIQAQVLNLMKKIQKDMDLTYIFIAHDLSVVEYMSDRILVMYLGEVVEIANSKDLNKNPKHPYTQALISAIPIPEIGKKKDRIVLTGDVPSPLNKPQGCPFHTRCDSCMEICKTVKPLPIKVGENHQVACHLYKEEVK